MHKLCASFSSFCSATTYKLPCWGFDGIWKWQPKPNFLCLMCYHQWWWELLKLWMIVGFLINSSMLWIKLISFSLKVSLSLRVYEVLLQWMEVWAWFFCFWKTKLAIVSVKTKLDIGCKCFVEGFSFQASGLKWHPNFTKLFFDY
jgi:hypothetical protein